MYETYWVKQAKESVKLVARNRKERRAMKGGKQRVRKKRLLRTSKD